MQPPQEPVKPYLYEGSGSSDSLRRVKTGLHSGHRALYSPARRNPRLKSSPKAPQYDANLTQQVPSAQNAAAVVLFTLGSDSRGTDRRAKRDTYSRFSQQHAYAAAVLQQSHNPGMPALPFSLVIVSTWAVIAVARSISAFREALGTSKRYVLPGCHCALHCAHVRVCVYLHAVFTAVCCAQP